MMLQYSHGEYQQCVQSQAHPTDVSSVSGTPETKRFDLLNKKLKWFMSTY